MLPAASSKETTMKKIPYHNTTDKPKHFGPVTVMPGCTRQIESVYLVKTVQDQLPAAVTGFSLEAFVKQKQADEISQLPSLSTENFAQVFNYYKDHDAPKKLRPVLDNELKVRDREAELTALELDMTEWNEDDFNLALLEYAEDSEVLNMIQTTMASRDFGVLDTADNSGES